MWDTNLSRVFSTDGNLYTAFIVTVNTLKEAEVCLFIERYRFNDVVVVTEVMREIYKMICARKLLTEYEFRVYYYDAV